MTGAAWRLQECGIGRQSADDAPSRSPSPTPSPCPPPDMDLDTLGAGHRVLVFAQLKGLLDLVESDVLRPAAISFMRLDGRSAAPPPPPSPSLCPALPCPCFLIIAHLLLTYLLNYLLT